MKKYTRQSLMLAALAVILGLVLSACGGTVPPPTAVPSLDGPETAAKGFYDGLYSGSRDFVKYACASDPAAAASAGSGLKSVFAASGVKIDASGMTYETISQTGNTAKVRVGGKFRMMINGAWDESDMPGVILNMRNENGWRVCGVSM